MTTLNNEINTQRNIFNLGFRTKLFCGFSAIIFVFSVAIIFVIYKISVAEDFSRKVVNLYLPAYNNYLDLNGYIYKSQAALTGWVFTHDPQYKVNYVQAWENIDRVLPSLDNFSKKMTINDRNNWHLVKSLIIQLKTLENKIYNLPSSSANIIAVELIPLINKIYDTLDGPMQSDGNRVGGLFDSEYDKLSNGSNQIITDMMKIQRIEYLAILICIALSIFIALVTAKTILRPLREAIGIAKKIAKGERNIAVTVTTQNETGELLTALDQMQGAIAQNELKLQKSEADARTLFENIVQRANIYSQQSSQVALGNLTQRVNIDNNDIMGQLGTDLNTMTDSLANITEQIITACHTMISSIDEVKNAVDMQSSGASEQASSINEITVSLEEIEKSSNQTMGKAKALGEIAEKTRAKGELGLDAVEQSILGMKSVRDKVQTIAQTILDLSTQTQQIGEITAVVNTLALQSKMLALNASIEAAKAGEAGKGFAVVATEVRNLAEQSEQSTSQVQKILEDIRRATEKAVMATEEGTKGVDFGTGLVEQTGEVVRSLSEAIHEATIASQQIETAIHQEGIGIEQITVGMNEINQVTSSFVDSVKQTTEAITHLASMVKSLKEHVDVYKL